MGTLRNQELAQAVKDNAEARVALTREGYVNAIQVWPFTDGALYQIYAAVGRVTVVSLQPGEELVTVAAGDTVRWIVGDTSSGSGADLRVNVLVKPIRSDLKTNLVITTSRRTYLLELARSKRAKSRVSSAIWSGPDIFESERGFLPDQFSFVPRLMADSRNGVHGLSSVRKDKDCHLAPGALTARCESLRVIEGLLCGSEAVAFSC